MSLYPKGEEFLPNYWYYWYCVNNYIEDATIFTILVSFAIQMYRGSLKISCIKCFGYTVRSEKASEVDPYNHLMI